MQQGSQRRCELATARHGWRHGLFGLFLLLVVLPALAAPPGLHEGDAKRALLAWLDAYNSTDRAQLQAFNDRYGITDAVDDDLEMHDSFGQMQLAEIRSESAGTVQALLLTEWGRGLLFTSTLKPGEPPRLSTRIEGVSVPAAFQPKPMPLRELTTDVGRRLDALLADDAVAGSLLLARDGHVLYQWQGGLADRERQRPITADTQFRFASLGKMFTAVAVLQLAEAGKLALDQPLAAYLPDYPNPQVAKAVTLQQLLSHTAGTGEVFDEHFGERSAALKTHRDYWGPYAPAPLQFTPGSKDAYSNYGFILLGAVIEAVSGQTFDAYLQAHVFEPAGMRLTGTEPETAEVPGRAVAYTRRDGGWHKETASLPWRGTAAGGGYSTTADLLRFALALQDGTLLPAARLQQATTAQNNKGWYGYGFLLSGDGRLRSYGHEGGAPGANAVLKILPESGYVLVALSNLDPSTMENHANYMSQRLP